MKQNLPNPMRDALARQAKPDTHLSPDVLTAFVEHALSGGAHQRVTEHLARCAECREVVFLASRAAEAPVAEERDWMQTAAPVPRISPVLLAKAHAPETMASASPVQEPRRRAPRLVWTATLAAAVLLVSGLLVRQRFFSTPPTSQLASKVASNAPALPSTEPQHAVVPQPARESAATASSHEGQTKPARAKSELPTDFNAVGMALERSKVDQGHPAVPPISSRNAAIQEPPTIAVGGLAPTPAAAPRSNSFAASEAEGTAVAGAATRQLYAIPQVSVQGGNVAHSQWRVTAEGHLEHFAGNAWTRVLANQTTAFRVVSVIGDEVWAGGSGGALFHSGDKGQQWGKVSVVTPSGTLTATIVSIQFDDPENGVVITGSGSRYSTNDGGLTWTSQ